MIDCESEVFTRIVTELRKTYPNINATSEYVREPSSFPHVCIEMTNNPIFRTRQGSSDFENCTIPTFTVNVYSNKVNGKKSECKAIHQIIDRVFYTMNFNRTAFTPVPNLENASIYRLVSRYTGVTDGKNFYRR